jgi:hypothetical protein
MSPLTILNVGLEKVTKPILKLANCGHIASAPKPSSVYLAHRYPLVMDACGHAAYPLYPYQRGVLTGIIEPSRRLGSYS